jgi:hypothetical protein
VLESKTGFAVMVVPFRHGQQAETEAVRRLPAVSRILAEIHSLSELVGGFVEQAKLHFDLSIDGDA